VNAISQMSRMTRGVRIVNPDSGDTIAAMARLAASVTVDEDAGLKSAERTDQETEVRAEEAAEGENGNGEAIEAELAALGDVAFDTTL